MEEKVKQQYDRWLSQSGMPTDLAEELKSIAGDEDAITDRFYRELEFGTGGLRGVIGAGTNRMNVYNIRKATQGLANYLNASDLPKKVAIGYDSRIKSDVFAKVAAGVFAANGVKVNIWPVLMPVPTVSFATRYLHTSAGVMVTASHNPSKYNGYKVYGEDGGQLVPKKADVLTEYVEKVKDLSAIDHRTREDLITWLGEDVVDLFIDTIFKESRYHGNPPPLKVVYTPLHGSGRVPVEKILGKAGFRDILIVKEQEMPDGDFPTVSSPNPENEDALSLGIRLGKETGADIVIGTDPDSDRIGAAVRKGSQFTLISGNQMGALLTYFLLSTGKDRLTPASTLVKTVVTGELAADIAESFHVQVVETLTGFKYIGEKITEWERNSAHDFVFGFEESYGYLAGTHARDKDAVVTAMLICEMAAYFKSLGKTLSDVLAELYETYGYYYDKSLSYTLKGLEGGRRNAAIMEEARSMDMKSVIPETVETLDFEKGIGGLPKENVLKYRLVGGGWFAIRPSGTEPKIKFYYSLRGKNEEEALRLFGAYRSRLEKQFGL